MDCLNNSLQQFFDPWFFSFLQIREDHEQFDILINIQLLLSQHLLRKVIDFLSEFKLTHNESNIHQVAEVLCCLLRVFQALEFHLLPKFKVTDVVPQGEEGVLMQGLQGINQIDSIDNIGLELGQLNAISISFETPRRFACNFVKDKDNFSDLLGGTHTLGPIEDFLNAALAQVSRNVGGIQLSELTEIKAGIDLLPPLEEVVLLVLHLPLHLLLLHGRLLGRLRFCLIFLLEEIGDDAISGFVCEERDSDESPEEISDQHQHWRLI